MTEYENFKVDGNTVWVDYGAEDKKIMMHVFLPTGEMFEDFVRSNQPIVFEIGEKQKFALGT